MGAVTGIMKLSNVSVKYDSAGNKDTRWRRGWGMVQTSRLLWTTQQQGKWENGIGECRSMAEFGLRKNSELLINWVESFRPPARSENWTRWETALTANFDGVGALRYYGGTMAWQTGAGFSCMGFFLFPSNAGILQRQVNKKKQFRAVTFCLSLVRVWTVKN